MTSGHVRVFALLPQGDAGDYSILLHQRNKGTKHPIGHPGGKLEPQDSIDSNTHEKRDLKETFLTGALREITEETGIDIIHLVAYEDVLEKLFVLLTDHDKAATVIMIFKENILDGPKTKHSQRQEWLDECCESLTDHPSRHIWIPLRDILKEKQPYLKIPKGEEVPIWYRTLNARTDLQVIFDDDQNPTHIEMKKMLAELGDWKASREVSGDGDLLSK